MTDPVLVWLRGRKAELTAEKDKLYGVRGMFHMVLTLGARINCINDLIAEREAELK